MKRKLLVRLFAVLSILSVFTFVIVGQARAADTAGPAQGIQISPVLIDLNANKGGDYTLKITVTNVTAQDLVLKGAVNDFKAKDETGTPEVILDDSETSSGFSFKRWVSLPQNIPLKTKESKVVSVDVNVPAEAEAGGHYGVVRFTGVPPGEENSNVSIAASVGVLVLARVDGTITESLQLKDFYIAKNNKRTSLAQNGPIDIVERIQNNGNVHVKPEGTITVKNMFGSTVASLPISKPARNILPDSTRKFTQTFGKKWMFGKYTARLEANYGYTNKTLTSSFTFWVIPYKLILISLLIIVLLFFILRKGLKYYNNKIVQKALNGRR